uniref:Uncharacterized protein n=1 Tax=Picea glauca TaxID=3330 RepID=A0A101M385_PICGL|nr:hypothetical protein ABT39_MTgene43 [Picea glauca]
MPYSQEKLGGKKRVNPYAVFQIQVYSRRSNIFKCVVDEGASMSLMSLLCWRDLGSLFRVVTFACVLKSVQWSFLLSSWNYPRLPS